MFLITLEFSASENTSTCKNSVIGFLNETLLFHSNLLDQNNTYRKHESIFSAKSAWEHKCSLQWAVTAELGF